MSTYYNPYGYGGIGADIAWCNKWSGGKRCLLCQHYAEFNDWSQNWHWFYLIRWSEYPKNHYHNYAHYKYSWAWRGYNWGGTPHIPYPYKIKPVRYRTAGLKERDIKQLLKRGCKPNRKCQCVSIAQRGNWYCPDCWIGLCNIAKYEGINPHDLMIGDRDELKGKMLLMRLSGIL